MAKNRNLKYQFKNCIDSHFKERINKHSLKEIGKQGTEVFSYSQRKNLIDLSSNFSNYMKENHIEIRQVKDINSNHIKEFLESKKNECSQKTLEQYQAQFNKLQNLVNDTYKANVNYKTEKVFSSKNGGGKMRTDMLSQSDYNKLLNNSQNENFKNALKLSYSFGLRVAECSKLKYEDITEKGIKIIDSKGGRSRFIPIENKQQKEVIKDFQNKKGRVCPIQSESLQKAFNREKRKNNINSCSCFHSSRKSYATNKYQEYREQGLTVQQSLDRVSNNLGHNDNRNDLMKEYICCPIQ